MTQYGSHIITYLSLILLLAIFGCKSDNQEILPGTWEMTEYRINHFDEHKDIKVRWSFTKDGVFTQLISYPLYETTESGKWTLKNEQTILINYDHNNMKVEWEIVYLNGTLLKVEHTTPGFFVERSFKKQ